MLSLRRLQSRAPRPRALLGLGAAALGAVSLFEANKALASRRDSAEAPRSDERVIDNRDVKPRAEHLRRLRDEQFDMLVIGGGVTGCGIALDAVTRGLSVAMVEQDDYSAGTSSRSTKLIHGGVRYLEKAFKNLDWGQFELVREALTERQHLLHIAPHLSRPLPIIVPFYQPFPTALFAIPYYWVGVKMYDLFAGSEGLLEPSYFMSRRSVRERFPMLSEKGLKGAMVYFDGQHNDSRMNLMIALTAAAKGAAVANHVSVVSLTQDESKTVTGAVVRDELTGDSWAVKARVTVNATGPFADSIRKMARPELAAQPIIMPSSGVHIVLSDRFSPGGMGMIVPQTTDGRVLFLLPWEGSTLAGTTDSSSDITTLPRPRAEEVNFILKELSHFMRTEIRPDDVDAAWSGIRPLARDPAAKSTASASRDHVIEPTAPGLYTIAGGKWTTYRSMAENLVDRVLEDSAPLREKAKGPCITKVSARARVSLLPVDRRRLTANHVDARAAHETSRRPRFQLGPADNALPTWHASRSLSRYCEACVSCPAARSADRGACTQMSLITSRTTTATSAWRWRRSPRRRTRRRVWPMAIRLSRPRCSTRAAMSTP
jgi:glycerol-3-phosphate dehydrogenase